LNQYDTDSFKKTIMNNEIETAVKKSQHRKAQGQMDSLLNFTRPLKK
jgi:hypothetical protein